MLDPNYDVFKNDAYRDADFAGMYEHKNPNYSSCAKSQTVFIVKFSDCPVLCIFKLNTKTSLSKMEAETIALAHFFLELFPIINIT